MRLLKHFLILLALFVQTVSAQSVANPKVTYFHNDITGTAVAATDEKGEVIWREQRRAYGEIKVDPLKPRSLDEFSVGYTGHQADKESGLTYAKARYYNKAIGRFYAPDPIPFRESDLTSFNRYAYAANNPYKYTDPTGKCYASIESGISCTSYQLDQQNLAINAANQEFSDGRYFSGIAGYAIGAAQSVNVAIGLVADMFVAPGNVTYNYTSGMIEGDYGRAQRAGVEGLSLAAGGKLGQMAVGTATKLTTEASKSSGRTVTKNALPKHTKHSLNQKINRQVKTSDELDAIRNPLDKRPIKYDSQGRPSQRYVGEKAEVAINPETNKIVSVNPTSSKKAARLKRRNEQSQ